MTGKSSKWANVRLAEQRAFARQLVDRVNAGEPLYDATWKTLMETKFLEEIRAKIHAVALLSEAGHDVSMIKIRSEAQLKDSAT